MRKLTILSSARRKKLKALARVAAYFATITIVLALVRLRSARADLANRSVELGRQMVHLANASDSEVNRLSLNGQPLWLGSSRAKDSPKAVLDRYASYCRENAAQPAETWRKLAQEVDSSGTKKKLPFLSAGGVRGGTDEEGSLVCFTKGAASKPTVTEALRAFSETGELGAFGGLRYVYAKGAGDGNTLVVTVWTDDRFNLADLIPEQGQDAGGADFPDLPRPGGATRLMAAQLEGTAYGVNVYEGGGAPSAVVAFYDAEMRKRSWRGLDPELDKTQPGGPLARLYEKNGVVLTVASSVEGGSTVTALGLAGVTAEDNLAPSKRVTLP